MQPCGSPAMTAENACRSAARNLDVVFFDMPGTLKNADVVKTISQMDYIFTPIIADRFVDGKFHQFATVFRTMMTTGQSGIKRAVPVLDDGGRTRKD